MKLKTSWEVIKEVVNKWSDDDVPRLGAALSFYTIFSLTPLLIIAIALIGFFVDSNDATNEIFLQIKEMVGKEGAELIQTTVKNAHQPETGLIATIVGLATMIIGATAVFIQLQESLNVIWKVRQRKGRGILGILKDRLISFMMVIVIGLIILAFLIITSVISILTNYVGATHAFILETINFIIISLTSFFLFAVIYKILPDVIVAWKDVWIGAFITSVLFVIGKLLVGLYLGYTTYNSLYGAAGSLAVLLLWIYYSSQILFLGAEFTFVYAIRFGSGIHPDKDAELVLPHPAKT